MNEFSQLAVEFFKEGDSCSEAVVRAACRSQLCEKSMFEDAINMAASAFSGAMGTHECLCGAVAGSQIVLGLIFGRIHHQADRHNIKEISEEFVKRFKAKRHATCCKILRAKFKDNPDGNRENCTAIVKECAEILNELIREKILC